MLSSSSVQAIACGLHHAAALATPADRRSANEQTLLVTWGRGTEGQLGTGGQQGSATPRVVDALRKRTVLRVCRTAGGA